MTRTRSLQAAVPASVNRNRSARDVSGLFGREEGNQRGELLGRQQSIRYLCHYSQGSIPHESAASFHHGAAEPRWANAAAVACGSL